MRTSKESKIPEDLEELERLWPAEKEPSSVDYLYKVVLAGDVLNMRDQTKSAILNVMCDEAFPLNAASTIGIDFKCTNREINGETLKLQIWDTAGQERYASMTRVYYRDTKIAFLICDLTQPTTLDSIGTYKKQITESAGDSLTTVLLCTNSNVYTKAGVDYKDADLDAFIAEHKITKWFKVDTQSPDGRKNIEDALVFAIRHQHLVCRNPRGMHSLISRSRSQHPQLLHNFAHEPGMALIFLSLFLNNDNTCTLFLHNTGYKLPKEIWIKIFSHFMRANLTRDICEHLAIDLTKVRLTYSFLSRLHREKADEPKELVRQVLAANTITDLRGAIASATNKDGHKIVTVWKSRLDTPVDDTDDNEKNNRRCVLQ